MIKSAFSIKRMRIFLDPNLLYKNVLEFTKFMVYNNTNDLNNTSTDPKLHQPL